MMSQAETSGMDNGAKPQKYAGRLRMRMDDIFTEVRATLSSEFLDLIPGDRSRVFLTKLNTEYGIHFDVDTCRNGPDSLVIRGTLEQIILSKIMLQKWYVIEDEVHPDHPHNEHNPFSRPSSNHVMKLRKVGKKECQIISPESYIVRPDLRPQPVPSSITSASSTPESMNECTPGMEPSRRKRGRPRKIRPPLDGQMPLVCNTAPSIGPDLINLQDNVEAAENANHTSMEIVVEPTVLNSYSLQEISNDVPPTGESYRPDLEVSVEFSCELCSFKAENEGQLLKHVLIHGKSDSVHKCDKCDFASVSLNHFQRHRLHHSDILLHCSQCTFQTDEPKLLSRHIALRHTLQLNIADNVEMSDAEAQKLIAGSSVLQCNECGYSTTKIYHFERHLLVHNRDLKGLLQVYQCEECGYKTHRKEHYVRHKENVHLKHKSSAHGGLQYCSYCGHSCKSTESLLRHLSTYHPGFDMQAEAVDQADFLLPPEDPPVESMPEQLDDCLDNSNVADVSTPPITIKLETDNVIDID